MVQSRRTTGLLVIGGVLAIVGSGLLFAGDIGAVGGIKSSESKASATPEGDAHSKANPGMVYKVSQMEYNESGFYFESFVGFGLGHDANEEYEDVMLCLYDDSGSVLNSTNIGTIKTPGENRENVTVTTSARPSFIIADHPGFHKIPEMQIEVYAWTEDDDRPGGGYYQRLSKSPTELDSTLPFEYPRRDEAGMCL